MQPVTVGTAKASPGETARGVIPAGRDFDGPIEIPVIVVRGTRDGPVLWIDGATHGDEAEGSITCWNLAKEVDAKGLAGTLVLVPILNLAAAKNGSRGNPLDHVNYDLNRVYPGKPNGRGTERLAWAYYQEFAPKADIVISLHSGGSVGYMSRVIYHNDIPASSLRHLGLAGILSSSLRILLTDVPRRVPLRPCLEPTASRLSSWSWEACPRACQTNCCRIPALSLTDASTSCAI